MKIIKVFNWVHRIVVAIIIFIGVIIFIHLKVNGETSETLKLIQYYAIGSAVITLSFNIIKWILKKL